MSRTTIMTLIMIIVILMGYWEVVMASTNLATAVSGKTVLHRD